MRIKKIGFLLLLLWAIVAVSILVFMDPIKQDISYHNFSDKNVISSIPNALNTLSNLPFVLIGVWGLYLINRTRALTICSENILAYYALFIGVALVAFGSGYYHLWPNNATLVWDRLPMTIAFMGLVSIIVSEFVSVKAGRIILLPLLLLGLFSVLYWHFTETRGVGDLRPYVFVQFFPMVGIPVILICFKSSFTCVRYYWWLMIAYLLAKVFEFFDYQIHELLSLVSGHSIKHISAAIGIGVLLSGFKNRKILTGQ